MLYYTYAMVGFVLTFILGVGLLVRKKSETYENGDARQAGYMQLY